MSTQLKRKRISPYSELNKQARRRFGSSYGQRTFTYRAVVPRQMLSPDVAVERKYFDSSYSAPILQAADFQGCEADPTTLNTLFVPATGDDINNRVGRKVSVLSIKIKGTVSIAPGTAVDPTNVPASIRCVLVMDKQTNSAQLNAEDVINSSGVAYDMFQNTGFFGRFEVLKDKRMQISNVNGVRNAAGSAVTRQGVIRPFKITHKFRKPIKIRFNSTTTSVVGAIVDNSFHMLANTLSDDFAPVLTYTCRTTYIDV